MEQRTHSPIELSAPTTAGYPWLASHLLQRQVVNITTLEPLGRIADVMFDPDHRTVMGIIVQLDDAPRGLGGLNALMGRAFGRRADISAVTLDHVVSLNGDVVTVRGDPSQLSQASALNGMLSLNGVCDLVILTTNGMSLGTLADILLDDRGCDIVGYVVQPTELARSILPLLSELIDPGPEPDETNVVNATAELPTSDLQASRLRVIPASSRVHFGESLIMLVSDVEPLRTQTIVISQQNSALTTTTRTLKTRWLSKWLSK